MSDPSQVAYRKPTLVGQPPRPAGELVRTHDAPPVDGAASLPAIVSDLWQHGERLVKAEMELGLSLAKAELNAHVERGKVTLRRTAIMSGFFYAGYLTLLAGLVIGLSYVMPTWLAAVGVGVISGLIGYAMLKSGIVAAPLVEAAHSETNHLTQDVQHAPATQPRHQGD